MPIGRSRNVRLAVGLEEHHQAKVVLLSDHIGDAVPPLRSAAPERASQLGYAFSAARQSITHYHFIMGQLSLPLGLGDNRRSPDPPCRGSYFVSELVVITAHA